MGRGHGQGERVHARQARQRQLRARGAWLIAADLASGMTGADVRTALKTRGTVGRGADAMTARARKIALYLAVTVANCRAAEVAAAIGMDPATVRQHVGWVAERMDDDLTLTREVNELEAKMIETATLLSMAALCLEIPEAA
jgi:DNA-binding CsgD family transcriptional regulator